MTVNSYLNDLAGKAVLKNEEQANIRRSINTLETRLSSYFENEISKSLIFGSYARGTILPRNMDVNSDIDYMIIFNGNRFKPQTYLDKLRRFVNVYYSSSEIAQSNPTIVLKLNHIKFELVPAVYTIFHGLQIPARKLDLNDWIDTNPNDINQTLTDCNKENKNLIKPMIRLVKYWNSKNNYPFSSFELEKTLINLSYVSVLFFSKGQLKDYFFHAIESLNLGWGAAQSKQIALSNAKNLIQNTKIFIEQGLESSAESEIKKLIPEQNQKVGLLWGKMS